jgi:enamine deaminase RidA (YjgF/YER057c/UK114 family)
MRKLISSGSPYEPKVGISRAVRVGPIITVAGTAPLGPDGRTVASGDAAAQARRCFEIIAAALEAAGASMGQVVRTRILLTRIEDWQAVAAMHGEFFRDIRPVNTIMQVSRFIDPEWLVEIEADAVVDAGGDAVYHAQQRTLSGVRPASASYPDLAAAVTDQGQVQSSTLSFSRRAFNCARRHENVAVDIAVIALCIRVMQTHAKRRSAGTVTTDGVFRCPS